MEPQNGIYEFTRRGLVFRADETQCICYLYTEGHEADFLAGLELTASLALEALGGLSIHGAAGAVNGTGYFMPGVSGTGKSTAIRHGGFEKIIGDERIFVLPSGNGWEMFSTPFWSAGRTQCPARCDHRLHSVIHLHQAKRFKLAALSTLNSLECFMQCRILWYRRKKERRST